MRKMNYEEEKGKRRGERKDRKEVRGRGGEEKKDKGEGERRW